MAFVDPASDPNLINTDQLSGYPLFPYRGAQTKYTAANPNFVCNPWNLEDDNALALSRYATGAFTGTVTGAAGAFVFPVATATLFGSGVGDPASTQAGIVVAANGAALALTNAETNAVTDGSLSLAASWFLVSAVGTHFGPACLYVAPLAVGAPGGVLVDAPTRFYANRAIRELMALVTMRLRYENTRFSNLLGLASQYPVMAGDAGADEVVTVSNPLAGACILLPFGFFGGARCGCAEIFIDLIQERPMNIASDTNLPTVDAQKMQIPVRVELYGMSYCPEMGPSIGAPAVVRY